MKSSIARGKFFTQRPSRKGTRDAKDTLVTSADMGTVPTYPKAEKVVSGAGSLANPPVNVKTIVPGGGDIPARPLFGGVPFTFCNYEIRGRGAISGYVRMASIYSTYDINCPDGVLTAAWIRKGDHQVEHVWRGSYDAFDFDGMDDFESFLVMVRRQVNTGASAAVGVRTDLESIWAIDDQILTAAERTCHFAIGSRIRRDFPGGTSQLARGAAFQIGWGAGGVGDAMWPHSECGAILFGSSLFGVGSAG